MVDKFLINGLSSLPKPLQNGDCSIVERGGVTYKSPVIDLYTNMYVDTLPATSLSLYHIGRDEFWQKVKLNQTISNEIYFVSGDYEHMYGRRICYVADPISAQDAATKYYVDEQIDNISILNNVRLYIDNSQASELSIKHISQDEYASKISSALSNELYVLSDYNDFKTRFLPPFNLLQQNATSTIVSNNTVVQIEYTEHDEIRRYQLSVAYDGQDTARSLKVIVNCISSNAKLQIWPANGQEFYLKDTNTANTIECLSGTINVLDINEYMPNKFIVDVWHEPPADVWFNPNNDIEIN